MLVAFRTDASAEMGTGHLRRCISLAGELMSKGTDVVFVCRNLGVPYSSLGAREFTALLLPAPATTEWIEPRCSHAAWAQVDWSKDAAETIAALKGSSVSALVVDHYSLDAAWHQKTRGSLRCPIIAIDDLGDRTLDIELLLDQNYARDHASKYAGRLSRETRILGGPSYALLDPAYSRQPGYQFQDAVHSIGVFMGGIDLHNRSADAIDAVSAAGFAGPVEVVTTTGNPILPWIQVAAGHRPNTQVTTDLPDLANFFSKHDLQIGAGGSATWERCCTGAPTLALALATNQEHVLAPLAELDVVATLPSDSGVKEIARAIKVLIQHPERRRALSLRSRQLVDGRGSARVADAILEICSAAGA